MLDNVKTRKLGKKLTIHQINACIAMLKDQIVWVSQPERVVAYQAGWSDDLIAKKLDCSVGGVQRIRSELYGTLRATPAVRGEAYATRLTSIESRIEALERWATDRRHTPFTID